jgi:hypothetical protein
VPHGQLGGAGNQWGMPRKSAEKFLQKHQWGYMRHAVSPLAKSGIFLPSSHVPNFSIVLQNIEMRVQRDGIFVSISDVSLLSSWDWEKLSPLRLSVDNLK